MMSERDNIKRLPESYRSDVTDRSDIDLAVTGIRKEDFFEIFGELMMALEHPVDLINLEKKNRFVTFLKEKRELVRVA